MGSRETHARSCQLAWLDGFRIGLEAALKCLTKDVAGCPEVEKLIAGAKEARAMLEVEP